MMYLRLQVMGNIRPYPNRYTIDLPLISQMDTPDRQAHGCPAQKCRSRL